MHSLDVLVKQRNNLKDPNYRFAQ